MAYPASACKEMKKVDTAKDKSNKTPIPEIETSTPELNTQNAKIQLTPAIAKCEQYL